MTVRKPPQEPVNTITTGCDIEMLGLRQTVLKINLHFLKRNDTDYLIIFFLDDNNPELIGVITVYPCE